MNIIDTFLIVVLLPLASFAQEITKPIGCFAGTNGTNSEVLSHTDVRGVLLIEKWSTIEKTPGIYDFSVLNNKVNTVKSAGLKYSLAISAGAFGSPDWLIDSLNVSFHSFNYQNQNWRLPLWWDTICDQKFAALITQLGNQYASDSMLSHVYISQMTVNGIEGHLNGVNMQAFADDGFTNQRWITAAKTTAQNFANAFPDKPIIFEVHEIDQDTLVPATIINDLTNDPSLCDRVGLGMWWISGKTTYQTDLIDFIYNFSGDKYAQVIGRSDQPERFQDSLYSTVFSQAKYLNIRYIEPWPFEFQHHTYDSLFQNFNMWADSNFSPQDTCSLATATTNMEYSDSELVIYPNPTTGLINLKIDSPYQKIEVIITNPNGQRIKSVTGRTNIDISKYPDGLYYITCHIDNQKSQAKVLKSN